MIQNDTPIKRMPFLDSLRGIAALMVVFHHFMVFNSEVLSAIAPGSLMRVFYFVSDLNVEAILFFFVLSGFSIGLAQKGELLNSRAATNAYLYKRFKRILPIYVIALALAALVGLVINSLEKESYSLTNLLGNILFLQTATGATHYWFSPYGQNGPLWSLAYEMFFYVLFPLFSLLLLKFKIFKTKAIVFVLLILCAFTCIAVNKYLLFIPPLAFLSFFIVWWGGFQIAIDYLNRKPDFIFWGILLIICMVLLALQHWIPSTSIIEIIKALLIACFLYVALFFNLRWTAVLKNRFKNAVNVVFNAIGHGSYALYALHYPVFILMSYFGIKWIYQIIFIFALIGCCIFLEKTLTNKKFKILTLNYMLINRKRIG